MHVLVTRPEPDATLQATKLRRLGHDVVCAPLLRVEFIPGVSLDLDGADALIATSRNALRALGVHPQRQATLRLPLFAVGEATAQDAAKLGFANVHAGPGTGKALARMILTQRGNSAHTLVHLSGEAVAFDLGAALEAEGFSVRRPILYRSAATTELPPEAIAKIEDGTLDGVILMSPSTASIFVSLVQQHGLEKPTSRLICYCSSQAVAQALAPLGARVLVAARPREEDVLALVATEAAS